MRRLAVVAQSAHQHVPCIHQLADQEAASDIALLRSVIIGTHLRKPQKDVSRDRSTDSRLEAPRLCQERHADAALSTKAEQERTYHDVSERHYSLQRVNRQTHLDLAVLLGNNRLTFPPEIHPLRLDVKRVKEFLHKKGLETLDESRDGLQPEDVRPISSSWFLIQ